MRVMKASVSSDLERTPRRNRSLLRNMLAIAIAGIAAIAVIATGRPANADDELYLTGTVKSVDLMTGMVYVDVLTSNCQGLRTFRADHPEKLEKYVDERISFFIDTVRCGKDTVHTIVVSRGVRQ